MKLNKIFILFLLLIFQFCSKDIDIKIPISENKIVVEGWIEQDKFPVVYLTMSFPFFSKIDSTRLFNLIVSRAKVTVSTDNKEEILTLKRDINYYPPFYYTGTEIRGEVGKKYDLKVEFEGKILTAYTIIEKVPFLDSLSFIFEKNSDSTGHLYFEFYDNPAERNYYRTFTKIKNIDRKYYPTLLNTYDDQYFNGEKIHFNMYKGYQNLNDYSKNDIYYKKGDTILVRLCSIDKQQFDFWNSYQGKVLNITSFAASQEKIKSNINGGLGVWGGYGASYYQIIAK